MSVRFNDKSKAARLVDDLDPTRRLVALNLIVVIMTAVLAVRLWQVQVLQGSYYVRLSEENRVRQFTIPAPRGLIYDRRGRPLVANRPSFTVAVLPLELRDPTAVLPRLAAIMRMPLGAIEAKIAAGRSRPYETVRIKRDVGTPLVTQIEENRLDLPGVLILAEPVRQYPLASMAAHVLGYVGEIDVNELADREVDGYKAGDLIGKDGVERIYESLLRGVDGHLNVEVDALGRPLRVLGREPAVPGQDITLTIDLDLQTAATEALIATGYKSGSVVVTNPATGEILALANLPSYDPNLFAVGIKPQAWATLSGDPLHPLLNRAVGAAYEPGSVFKLVTATAALQERIVTRSTMFNAPGYFQLGRWRFGDLKAWGSIDFLSGIANSVNVVFYTLGYQLGGERLAHYATMMGLGERTGIDLPGEIVGTIATPATKQKLVGEPWYPGDSVNMSIGQGALTVTPIQVARMVGSIANGGTLLQPHVLLKVTQKDGTWQATSPTAQRYVPYDPNALSVVRDGMRAVVVRGSGTAAALPNVALAGKTGSAENPRGQPHAWFAGYAPAEAPRIVVVAFVEHGFRGGLTAAPLVRRVFGTAFPETNDPGRTP